MRLLATRSDGMSAEKAARGPRCPGASCYEQLWKTSVFVVRRGESSIRCPLSVVGGDPRREIAMREHGCGEMLDKLARELGEAA